MRNNAAAAVLIAAASALAGCEKAPRLKEGTADTTTLAPIISRIAVSAGSHGMGERIRWSFSPDRRAVLVIDDPVSIEDEPMPNSFFFGDEATGFQLRRDSIWDVSVSPDWKALAFSRAFRITGINGQFDDSVLRAVSRQTSIDTATLRAGAFPLSGMSEAQGIAQPGIVRVPANPRSATAGDSAAEKMFPIARGWQVRWTTDGAMIALGNAPMRALDGEPSEGWTALDPRTGEFHGSLPSTARIFEPKFFSGPSLHGDTGTDLSSAPVIRTVRNGRDIRIVSERGVITIGESGPADSSTVRPYVVGSGSALAATAGGGYILALSPRAKVESGESGVELVVYRVSW